MQAPLPRRAFLKLCGQLGVAGCCSCSLAFAGEDAKPGQPPARKLPALKTLAYCGLVCGERCELFKATVANDTAAKEKVFKEWGWKEKFGMEFDPARVFCHGCKPGDKPLNVAESKCTVRQCTRERGLESCIQCGKLAACDKELWKNWPKFKQHMEKLQQQYLAAGAVQLV